jgi:hypothetical protein
MLHRPVLTLEPHTSYTVLGLNAKRATSSMSKKAMELDILRVHARGPGVELIGIGDSGDVGGDVHGSAVLVQAIFGSQKALEAFVNAPAVDGVICAHHLLFSLHLSGGVRDAALAAAVPWEMAGATFLL